MAFEGTTFRLPDQWTLCVPLDDYKHKPIYYLEIGAHYGANIIGVAKTYGSHPESKLYCIDPWEDYVEYPEYKGKQETIYSTFIKNVENSGNKGKIIPIRGYSNIELLKFQDNIFDIIYIDGNHESEYVLEDAVLSFRKLKSGGVMIFDDYDEYAPETMKGINAFLHAYEKRITILTRFSGQLYIKKNN
jgi:hypothetical protein